LQARSRTMFTFPSAGFTRFDTISVLFVSHHLLLRVR
jgi:hypothetical protein